MSAPPPFSPAALNLDCSTETDRITRFVNQVVSEKFRKRGVVLGLSGGIDSSVVAALCVRALGKERVLGLLMPEKESSSETLHFSRLIADHLEIQTLHLDITEILTTLGCYRLRDQSIQTTIPEYTSAYKCKIVLPSVLQGDYYRLFSVEVESPEGHMKKKRLSTQAYLGILSASNFKQRVRKMIEYFHADRMNYAVAGTPNRLEYDQGFFVKLGDGAADIKPIAHLYKTQVYEMAESLGIPWEIRQRPPTTDTYSMPQSQEEFYFSLPYDKMDLCLFGKNNAVPISQVALASGLTESQVELVFRDIEAKREATKYLHSPPVLVEKLMEIFQENN